MYTYNLAMQLQTIRICILTQIHSCSSLGPTKNISPHGHPQWYRLASPEASELFVSDHPHRGQGGVLPLLEMISASLFHLAGIREDRLSGRRRPLRLITQGHVESMGSRGWVRNGENFHVGKKTFVHRYLFSLAQGLPIFL